MRASARSLSGSNAAPMPIRPGYDARVPNPLLLRITWLATALVLNARRSSVIRSHQESELRRWLVSESLPQRLARRTLAPAKNAAPAKMSQVPGSGTGATSASTP